MVIESVAPRDLGDFAHLTFPTTLFDARRHQAAVVAFAASVEAVPCGLAIAMAGPRNEFEILSLFVTDLFRRRGVGTRLLATIEQHFAGAGSRLGVHFLTVDPADQGPVHFLLRRHWTRPQVTALVCHSTVERMFGPAPPSSPDPPDRFSVISWADVCAADRARIATGIGTWIPADLDPLSLEPGYDADTSVALISMRGGERRVAGWVITHRIAHDTLRWTCSFVDPALQSAVRIMPLWWEVGRRQRNLQNADKLIFTVPLHHPRMVKFGNRYIKPRLEKLQYACTTRKLLIC